MLYHMQTLRSSCAHMVDILTSKITKLKSYYLNLSLSDVIFVQNLQKNILFTWHTCAFSVKSIVNN